MFSFSHSPNVITKGRALFAFMLLSGILLAAPMTAAITVEGKGNLVCKSPSENFGEVEEGISFTHVFVLSNDGDADVTINRVGVTCNWAKPKLYGPKGQVAIDDADQGKTELVLHPKQKGRLYIQVDTSGLDKNKRGRALLYSDGTNGITPLTFDMKVIPSKAPRTKAQPEKGHEGHNHGPGEHHHNEPPAPSGPAPKLVFDKYEHDFGPMLAGEKSDAIFTMKNEGPGELVVTKIYASCGCTVPKVETEDGEIRIPDINTGRKKLVLAKGQSAKIGVEFDTKGLLGNVKRNIRVYSNDASQNPVYLNVKCQSSRAYELNPMHLRFTPIMRRHSAKRSVTFKPTKLQDCQILECVAPEPFVNVDFVESTMKDENGNAVGDRQFRIDVTVTEDAPVGSIMKPVVIRTSNEKIKEFTVPLFARVIPEVSFKSANPQNPEKIEFGVITTDKDVSRDLEIINANSEVPYTITKHDILSRYKDHLKLELITLDAGTKYILRVTALGSLDARYFQGVVRLQSDHPDLPTKDITFHGWVKRKAKK